ncbi:MULTISPECIES: hypothetical protein [unclassified Cupriavidus]|uniref:hypothetical protein n=1 Tax=unclassified Cupriavidus TaxID=2640874 RepID=UPI001054438D|nr:MULTISPECIES: hypothetical protein [unclassified Cupriavidus]MBF6990113.1 hypothetical protein [Cupriavidus sp. IK-TO18]TDF64045.1 hypothetical protein E1J61_20230 [Cupriavidus sp. L7L]
MIAGFGGKLIAGAAERDYAGDFAIPRHPPMLAESHSKDQPVILQPLALPPGTRAGTHQRVLTAAPCPDASARRLIRQANSNPHPACADHHFQYERHCEQMHHIMMY